MHRFNRYELKYLVPIELVPTLRSALRDRLDADPISDGGSYAV